ncbi:MAG TPA: universal stress protein [Humidesulfovibrio sp.]|uniref:universal stress protein n=1 Tax=Humidesulfovibrio sp. TaxID=2910988 RepID=UPI002B8166AF|nr:universal stress protein [Humidesulfovibrio sp.]HWR02692.1 universal stress protein [Humidesulfovibrio sp.]
MNILLALDDSARAMDEAVRLASERKAGLTALFVLDTGWSVYIGSDFLLGSTARSKFLEYTRDDEYAQERATVEAFQERAKKAGLDCTIKTATAGRVPEAILAELAEGGYDTLVMSQPFRRGLEVMRDATAQVLKKAPCDVLFVKRED